MAPGWPRLGAREAAPEQLIEAQYADYPALRAVLDGILRAARSLGSVEVQARKTYISLRAPRRTFARVQRRTQDRVDLQLRLERVRPGGRLRPSKVHATMRLEIGLTSADQVDAEVVVWLRRAYLENS